MANSNQSTTFVTQLKANSIHIMEEYNAKKNEIAILLNDLNEQESINEIYKAALCEWVCEKVCALSETDTDQAADALQEIFAKFNGNIEQVDDAFERLTAPRILSGELSLAQLVELKGYISDAIFKMRLADLKLAKMKADLEN